MNRGLSRAIKDKRLIAVYKAAIAAGWPVARGKNGFLLYPPSGNRPIAIHTSDRGGFRGQPSAVTQAKREGLNV